MDTGPGPRTAIFAPRRHRSPTSKAPTHTSGLFHTYETLASNKFASFHHTLDGTRSTANNPLGATEADIDKAFLAKLGADPLAKSLFVSYEQLRCNSPDFKLVGEVIAEADKIILDKWADLNDAQALLVQHGLQQPAAPVHQGTGPAASMTVPPSPIKPVPVISAPAQFALDKYALALVKLAPNQADQIDGEPFSPAFQLDATFTACVTTPKQVNPQMMNSRLEHFSRILRDAELHQYAHIKFNTMNKATMSQLSICNWHASTISKDKYKNISVGCFVPRSSSEELAMKNHNNQVDMDEAIQQSDNHRVEQDRSVYKSWTITSWGRAKATLIQYNGFLLFISGPTFDYQIRDRVHENDKQYACICLERLIRVMSAHATLEWVSDFRELAHLAFAIVSRVQQAMGKVWSAADDHTLFDDMAKKKDILFSNRGNGAALTKALLMLETISIDLEEAVDAGETGNFSTPPAMYSVHCVVEKKRKSELEKDQTREAKKSRTDNEAKSDKLPKPKQAVTKTVKLFHLTKPGVFRNYKNLKLPKFTINGKSDSLCGKAHLVGSECTKPTCPFAHAVTLKDITCGMAALVAYEKAEASVAWEPKVKAAAVKQAADQRNCKSAAAADQNQVTPPGAGDNIPP